MGEGDEGKRVVAAYARNSSPINGRGLAVEVFEVDDKACEQQPIQSITQAELTMDSPSDSSILGMKPMADGSTLVVFGEQSVYTLASVDEQQSTLSSKVKNLLFGYA